MAGTVGDKILERLREWDVGQVFAYPGDGINGLLAAWGRAEDKPQFVQSRHEEMSAFEAVGYAKFSGRVGVCAATSGPGAVHLLNGLYDAKLDHVPVVAIVGQTERSAMGGSYQQEVDLLSLFKDVCGEYVHMCTVPQQLPNLIDRAIRVALSEHTPTCLIFPSDVLEEEWEAPEHAFKQVPSSLGIAQATAVPDPDAVRAAADILNAGEKVAMLVGQGARGAAEEVTQVAELLGAGVAKALLGKDVLPDDLPFVTGSIGLLGTTASYDMMMDCDTLLTVGSNFPYTQFMPKLDQARAIQIDRDGKWIGMRYPYELNVVGDAKATLAALIPLLQRKSERTWRETIEENVADWWQTIERQAMTDADPVNPLRIFHELSQRVPDNAIIASDSGSAANWYARNIKFHGDMRGSLSGTLATMGPAVPYVIGAKWAHPDRPTIALTGDGAMQMNGLAELITVKHYWRQWADPRLVVAILHNNDLNQVTWEMRAMEGSPKFAESQTLPDVDYAAFAPRAGPGRGHHRLPGPAGPRVGRGAVRGPPDGAGRALQRGHPPDPAARVVRAGEGDRVGDPARGRGRPRRRQGGHQAEGPAVPARLQGQLRVSAALGNVRSAAYRFPTGAPESDGTYTWEATTAVVVQVDAGGQTGLGWTFSTPGAAAVVTDLLAPRVTGSDALDVPAATAAAVGAIRNVGTGGLAMQAVSALDVALWDLKARLLGVGLPELLGRARDAVPVYGSGGFTSLSADELAGQVSGWLRAGCRAVKIKVGQDRGTAPDRDLARTREVRELVGDGVRVMVDANGGYSRGQARRLGGVYDELGVTWFEEPVSSDDLDGLAAVRGGVRCEVAAGEYVASPWAARALCPVVDVLQLDATRCGGYTGFLACAAVAAAHNLPVSAHCAPALHVPVALATPNLRDLEWFADHAALEPLLLAEVRPVVGGALRPLGGPGHGMALAPGVECFRVA